MWTGQSPPPAVSQPIWTEPGLQVFSPAFCPSGSVDQSTWLRTRGSGVRIPPGAPRITLLHASLAQWIRALDYESRGRRFESCMGHSGRCGVRLPATSFGSCGPTSGRPACRHSIVEVHEPGTFGTRVRFPLTAPSPHSSMDEHLPPKQRISVRLRVWAPRNVSPDGDGRTLLK